MWLDREVIFISLQGPLANVSTIQTRRLTRMADIAKLNVVRDRKTSKLCANYINQMKQTIYRIRQTVDAKLFRAGPQPKALTIGRANGCCSLVHEMFLSL